MFSLIITIISIVLVAALALATIYYGGSAFTGGSAKAAASTVVSQAQQISGAITLSQNDNGGAFPADVAALVSGNYLQAAPIPPKSATADASWGYDSTKKLLTLSVKSKEVCEALVKSIDASGTPAVSTAATAADLVAADITNTYGCVTDNATTPTKWAFGYKL